MSETREGASAGVLGRTLELFLNAQELVVLALMQSEIAAISDRDRAVFLETYLRALGPVRGSRLVRAFLLRMMSKSKDGSKT